MNGLIPGFCKKTLLKCYEGKQVYFIELVKKDYSMKSMVLF
jgi:hypothetical protein